MRALPILLCSCLSLATVAYADDDADDVSTQTSDTSNLTKSSAPLSKPPESSVRPQTYMHPSNDEATVDKSVPQPMNAGKMSEKNVSSTTPMSFSESDCYITVRNDGLSDVNVYGRFDDGVYLTTYLLPWYGDYISYVSLYYNGYCHGSMEFYIEKTDGTYKYNGYTPVGKVVRIK